MASRLFLFEDNAGLRNTLSLLINESGTYITAGAYGHCDNWQELFSVEVPDVIIMDIDMPGIGGIQGVKEIKQAYPHIKVIMYTVFDDDDRIFECLCHGANGYILKNTSLDSLIGIIDDVMKGGAMMSPSVAARVVRHFQQQRTPQQTWNLTNRELEILRLLARGNTYKRIGEQTFISPETVKKHLKNIYTKLQVSCGTEAVAKALKDKIIQLD